MNFENKFGGLSPNSLSKALEGIPGFKISDAHFRIGGKIHLTDFYYAKRFFQNGFFASRVAYLLTRDIGSDLVRRDQDLGPLPHKNLSIVGYGQYSELLISLTAKFLREHLGKTGPTISYDVVVDSESMRLSKGVNLGTYCIVIVPIATTFSTGLKIADAISRKFNDKSIEIHDPYYNVIWVSDENYSGKISDLEHSLGWQVKNRKKQNVEIRAFHSDRVANHKYYFDLPTGWRSSLQCDMCFPSDAFSEKPLFETDKTSVTPALIFDYPVARQLAKEDRVRPFSLTAETIQWGHHVRNDAHFLFAIDTELFLRNNRGQVTSWLRGIKEELGRLGVEDHHYVVLVAPCHYSNSQFLDLVNQELFGSAANTLHYDSTNDFTDNFRKLYGPELFRADYIFFVDDSLKSGSSFFHLNSLVKHALRPYKTSTGIHACITLINKSERLVQELVLDEMQFPNGQYSFAHIHAYGPVEYGVRPALVKNVEEYQHLAAISNLDSLRHYFLEIAAKLSPNRVKSQTASVKYLPASKRDRRLQWVAATHYLYEFLSGGYSKNVVTVDLKGFIHDLRKYVQLERLPAIGDIESISFEDTVVKVLSARPFNLYKPIRSAVFTWILSAVEAIIDRSLEPGSQLTYENFERIKFFMRRLALLDSNFLLCQKWLEFVQRQLYGTYGLPALEKKLVIEIDTMGPIFQRELKHQLENVRDFPIYLVGQAKSVLRDDSARAIVLEENLLTQDSIKHWQGRQVLRMLQSENCGIIRDFCAELSRQKPWRHLYGTGATDEIDENVTRIEEYLMTAPIMASLKGVRLTEFLGVTSKTALASQQDFLAFLWVLHFLTNDRYLMATLEDRTVYIMQKLCVIVGSNDTGARPNTDVGSFLVVNDIRENPTVVHAKRADGWDIDLRSLFHSFGSRSGRHPFLASFLRGESDSSGTFPKSIVELWRNAAEPESWFDAYTMNPASSVEIEPGFLPEACDTLLLIRIAHLLPGQHIGRPQGLIGFFLKRSEANACRSPRSTRFLLTLRDALSLFIKTHHENNEFLDWRLANEAKKLALLTGHGQDILFNLARGNEPEDLVAIFAKIAILQVKLQQDLLLYRRSASVQKLGPQGLADVLTPEPSLLDSNTVEAVNSIAAEVFKSTFVETEIPVHIVCKSVGIDSSDFSVDTTLLHLIFFELFLNAKRNRWDFVGDDQLRIGHAEFVENHLNIEISVTLKDLEIIVKNTGPTVSEEFVLLLNDKTHPVKPSNPVSGLSLLKSIIAVLGGTIRFRSIEIDKTARLSWFRVKIVLPKATFL